VSEQAKVAVEPPKPAPAAPAAEVPSAFASFDSPLELLDFASMSAEPAVETPVPAAPAKEKPKAVAAPKAAPKPALQTELLLDIARQHAAGKTAEASGALEAALRAGTLGKATEQGWGMLFDLLQILNRRQAFENLADAYARAIVLLPAVTAPPAPALLRMPPNDLLTLFSNETRAWTPGAQVGWVIALAIELLNFIAIWRGGRRVAMADRVPDWKDRIGDGWVALWRRRRRTLLAIECFAETVFHQPLANILDGLGAAPESIGDARIGPSRPVGICFEKDLGSFDLLTGSAQLLDDVLQFLAFLIVQPNDILFLHGTPPCST